MAEKSFLVRQISIFMSDKPGSLAKITRHLAAHGINLRGISLIPAHDYSTARIVVPDPDKCIEVLKKANYRYSETDVLAIEVADRVGGFADVLEIIAREHLNVDYIYSLIDPRKGLAGAILHTNDLEKTIDVLKAKGVRMLTPGDIASL